MSTYLHQVNFQSNKVMRIESHEINANQTRSWFIRNVKDKQILICFDINMIQDYIEINVQSYNGHDEKQILENSHYKSVRGFYKLKSKHNNIIITNTTTLDYPFHLKYIVLPKKLYDVKITDYL